MANLFEPYNFAVPAVHKGTSTSAVTDAVTGEGILALVIPSNGRYPLGGLVLISSPVLGDTLSLFEIRDIDGVIPSPARGAFPDYPTLISRLENPIYFTPEGALRVDNPAPVYLLAGLYIYVKVVKATPSAVNCFMNIEWMVPT